MTTPSPIDSDLRRFVLGTAEDDSEAFTLFLLQDALDKNSDALLEVLADEDDLIDEFVRGELDADSAQRFESLILSHSEGRRRVAFANALAKRIEARSEQDATAARPALAASDAPDAAEPDDSLGSTWWRKLLSSLQAPAARPAWAVCAVLLTLAAAQTYRLELQSESLATTVSEPPVDARSLGGAATDPVTATDSAIATEPATETRLAQLSAEADDLRRRLDESTEDLVSLRAQLEAARASAPKLVKALLAAATRGSHVPTLDVPADTDQVEFQVDLAGGPDVTGLRVRLLNAAGLQVWGRPFVETEGEPGLQALRLRAPAQVLRAGAYTLILETEDAEGTWSAFGQHEFRIVRD